MKNKPIINKSCNNCFHRSIETNPPGMKDYSYCNIKKKRLTVTFKYVCEHYEEDNIWKEKNDERKEK